MKDEMGTQNIIPIVKNYFYEANTNKILRGSYESIIENEFNNKHEVTLMSSFVDVKLKKLTITVTNACNLNCSYCYAGGGSYNKAVKTMTKKLAKEVVNWMLMTFKLGIENVQFFGGEPLLALNIIGFICEEIERRCSENNNLIKPQYYSIVTNGTLLTNKAQEILNKYKINLTISLDGPQDSHDAFRVYKKSNKGSYNDILTLLKKNELNREYNIAFQVTVTDDLVPIMTPINICEFFSLLESFNPSLIHINHVTQIRSENEEKVSIAEWERFNRDLYDYIYKLGIKKMYKDVIGTLSKISKPISAVCDNYCSAGINEFCVDEVGGIYPCFMFQEFPEYQISHILEYESQEMDKSIKNFQTIKKSDNSKCLSCWLRNQCSSCIAEGLLVNKEVGNNSNLMCENKKNKMLEVLKHELVGELE
ncbi:radical SAM/SPASM domain-containing protein [uncultured Vagococcus sp.]|uniref:radical SAM/SPASM domain-containing protein n=1 Tax=uncultured Vagococcus sp. TaxID=189676 RepID=UPI0028D3D1B7|nr:radical SAM protein [uncultured Vagococcus sp.]